VPSAFSMVTGEAHWEVFVRSRAAETGCFVIAPGQVGLHEGTRRTWGHSMIVNPWGKILAEADGETPGIIMAELDLSQVEKYRENIPALKNEREFTMKSNQS
jgi:predicted amidohydrolase